jgi:RND family efflux transporter MFP subunit
MKKGLLVGVLILGGLVIAGIGYSTKSDSPAQESKIASRPAVAVEVVSPIVGEVLETLDVIGSLSTRYEAAVRSEYPGIISEVEVHDWVEVKKGDVLVRLDTREIDAALARAEADVAAAEADVLKSEAASDFARHEHDRVTNLSKASVVPEKSLDDATRLKAMTQAELGSARAKVMVAQEMLHQARLRLEKSVLRAPMDGIVSSRKANIGDRSDGSGMGEPLFRIVNNRVLNLVLSVPSTSLGRVQSGQPITFTTDALPGKTFTATVMHINPRAEYATRSVDILAEVQNESGELRDGLFVKGGIATDKRDGVMQIPRMAVLQGDSSGLGVHVFVLQRDVARMRRVETGKEMDDMVEIVSGLELKDQVVTRGAFLLHEGDPVRVEPPALRLSAQEGA